jgi:chromosome segregation ATPase
MSVEWMPAGSPPRPHGAPSRYSSTGQLELAIINQRLEGVEDRLQSLESLVSRTVAKLDEQASRLTTEIRSADFLRLQQQAAHDAQEQFAHHVREQLGKLVGAGEAQEERIARINRDLLDHSTARTETRFSKIEAKLAQIDHTQRESSATGARQLAQAMKLLQAHISTQVETLSASVSAKLLEAEKESAELVSRSQEMQATFVSMKNVVTEARFAAGKIESEVLSLHSAQKQFADELKVVNRRLLSAVRHLSANPSDFMEANEHMKTPPRKVEAVPESGPLHRPGSEIDAFVAELNFLTRNI